MKSYTLVFLILTGCGSSIKTTALIQTPPRDALCKLDVYTDIASVTKKHKTVGLVEVVVGNHAEVSAYIPKFKAEACKLGADAIVLPKSMAFPDYTGIATAIKFDSN